MKTFREILAEVEASKTRFAFYHYASDDAIAATLLESIFNESTQTKDLGKGRSMMFHRAHVDGGQDHVHFLVKGSKITALNRDGSAHDRSHGHQLLQWQINGLRQHQRNFALPKDGLIEQLMADDFGPMLTESLEAANDLVALMVMAESATGLP